MIPLFALALAAAQPACPEGDSPDASTCRAVAALNAGQPAASAEAFEAAARGLPVQDPAAARAWAAAGNMWLAADQPGKAALALDRAIASGQLRAEQLGEAHLDRARAAAAQNDLAAARAAVTRAQDTVAEDPFLWYFSAALAIREGDPAAARTAINRALALAPSDPTILFEAGHVAHFGGDLAGARAYWQRAAATGGDRPIGKAARDAIAMLDSPAPVQNPASPPR